MNPEFYGPPDRHDDERLSRQVCQAVSDASFDYAALVEGVHHRAGRIRRRRAITTGALVAVLAPALVGGSAMVLPGLLPGGVGTVIPADAPVAAPTETATETATKSPTESATEPVAVAHDPPWQESDPPLPADGLDDVDSDNAWDVPDARPTGVNSLEALGPPTEGGDYRLIVPVWGAMTCDAGQQKTTPLPMASQGWGYFDDVAEVAVDIQVTGWEDSTGARDDLREGTMTYCIRDVDGDWDRIDWAGHEGDDDYLLYEATSDGIDYDIAVVRQGDYLIGVTVTDDTRAASLELAAEIASKTADNMAALDPIHGRD